MTQNHPEIPPLAGMSKAELRKAWEALREPVPAAGCTPELLRYGLAWKIQAEREGGLKAAARRRLAALIAAYDAGRGLLGPRTGPEHLGPGTTLVRRWRGRTYTVMSTVEGFVLDGRTYASLSQVAHAITGTRWNGPAFFGLRKNKNATREAA